MPEPTLTPLAGPAQQGPPVGADAPQDPFGREEAVSRAEFNKVVAQRQATKERLRELTAEVERLLGRLGAVPSDDELNAFRRWQQLQADAGIGPDQQGRDLQAIAGSVRGPLTERIEELRGRKEALERRLTDLLRDQLLRVAAARADAINPEQVIALLRGRVRMTETADGQYAPQFLEAEGRPASDGAGPVTDAQQFVSVFLSRPENANLVRSTVVPGSGARQAGGAAATMDFIPRSRAEFLALPPEQRRAVAARMTRPQRDAVLGRGPAAGGGYL
ncbi:MAG TPA: hypothetical protein VM695_09595 [Phycisphaerae bacterium]|nr:hypothetical protein [Phycisphaerae bacterium]